MKISYIISHGVGELYDFDPNDHGSLTLTFKPECDGALTLGSSFLRVTDGEVTIPTKALRDGEHTPRLECDEGVFLLPGFTKHGRGITPAPTDHSTTRRLVLELYRLAKKQSELEERIAALEKLCCGNTILNYERNTNEKQA